VHDAAQRCADLITTMTDGALTVDVKAAGELVGAFEVFDAVSSGQADIYHGADYYWVGQHPAYAFFTAVPMGMTAQELSNWYYQDGGMALHDELNAIFGLKGFLGGNTGAQGGGWFRNEIKSAADFNGLKFRMPGLGGKALGKMGASVQNIPGGEIYQALSSGAIDGTEWIGAWADEKMGFQEITKIYYTAGFHEPGAGLSVTFNRALFESFTPAQQKICEIAASETHQWNLAQFLANNGAALARLQAAGVKVNAFPDDVWDAFAKATNEVHAENMGDELYKKIYDSAMASMKSSSAWLQLTDGAYVAQRNRTQG
jgi:TRAP-type mannitol/chloroaromatic compound transport system substrate-binding protein